MSNVIDSKIVEMKFDNSNFEKNVKTSMESLDSLNKAIDKGTSSDGMKKFGDSVDVVSGKFSALESVAFGFFASIGSKIADLSGKLIDLAGTLSFDQIGAGWDKYAEKTTAVATIMAATQETWKANAESVGFYGEQIDFVSEQLDRLNWFTDETSYDFVDMTGNIGKFTANSVQLTDAVTAMEGISTWAALSGQNASTASRAMYNLSQALSLGAVKLQDWKSIENANMATTEFKWTAIDTALALGRLHWSEEGLIETTKGTQITADNLRETLSEGWFDSEVLMSTLDRYGGFATRLGEVCEEYDIAASEFHSAMDMYVEKNASAADIQEYFNFKTIEEAERLITVFDELGQEEYNLGRKAFWAAQEAKTFKEAIDATKDAVSTSWLNVFEAMFGNYEQAKVFWTNMAEWLYDIFAEPVQQLQRVMGNVISFRINVTKGLYNSMEIITKALDTVKGAFSEIFPIDLEDKLRNFGIGFKNITRGILENEEAWNNLSRILKGVFAAFSIIFKVIKVIYTITKGVIQIISPFVRVLFNFLAIIGDGLVQINEDLSNSEKLASILYIIAGALDTAAVYVNKLVDSINYDAIKSWLSDIYNSIKDKIIPVLSLLLGVIDQDRAIKDVENSLSVWERVKNVALTIYEFFSKVANKIKEIAIAIGNFLAPVFDKIKEMASAVWDWIKGNITFDDLSRIIVGGITAGAAVGIAVYVKKISKVFASFKEYSEIGKKFAEAIGDILKSVKNVLNSIANDINAEALKKVAIAVAILAGSLIALSLVPHEKLAFALLNLTALFGELVVMMKFLAGPSSTTWPQAVQGMMDAFSFNQKMSGVLKFSIAVTLICGALALLAQLDPTRLGVALAAVTAIIGEIIAVALILSKNDEKLALSFTGVWAFGQAIRNVAKAMKMLADMTWDELIRGLVGLTVVMGVIVGFSISINKTQTDLAKISFSLIVFSIGLMALSLALKFFAKMSIEDLIKSLAAVTILLGVITGMGVTLSKTKSNLVKVASGLAIFGVALVILSSAMAILGSISWEGLVKGLSAVIVLLGVIVGFAVTLSSTGTNLIKIGSGLIIFAIGLSALLVPLAVLMTIPILGLVKAIGAMAAVLFTVVAIGYAARGAATGLIALGMSLIGIGAGAIFVGMAMILIGKGLVLIGAGLAAAGAGLLTFIAAIASIIPTIVSIIGTFISNIVKWFARAIGELAPLIVDALMVLLKRLLQSIVESAGMIFDTIIQLLGILSGYIPQIVDMLAEIIVKAINTLADHLPEIVVAVINFINKMFAAVGQALGGMNAGQLATAILELAGATLILAVVGTMGPSILYGIAMMAAVVVALGALLTGLGALMTYVPEIEQFIEKGIPVFVKIGSAIGSFIGNFIGGMAEGVMSVLPSIGTHLSNFMTNLTPFIDGIKSVDSTTAESAKYLADAVIAFAGAGLVDALSTLMGGDLVSFGDKLNPFAEDLVTFAETISKGEIDAEAVKAAAEAGSMVAEFARAIPNSGGILGGIMGENDIDAFGDKIVPFAQAIVDFSNVVKGEGTIDKEAVEKASEAGKLVAALADSIPNSGGALGFIMGDNDLDKFGEKIVPFAKAVVDFSNEVTGNKIDAEAIKAATDAGLLLTALADTVPNSGGFIGWIVGNNDLDAFGDQLVKFGIGMRLYSAAITAEGGIDSDAISSSAVAGQALAELATKIPSTGGFIQKIAGQKDLGKFGTNLTDLGTGLANYSKALQEEGVDFKPWLIRSSATAAISLAELAKHLPLTGGFIQKIAGQTDLGKFGENLTKLGEGMADYSSALQKDGANFNADLITSSANAASALAKVHENLPDEGGWIQKIAGQTNLGNFGDNLEKLGKGMANYSRALTEDGVNFDAGAVTASADAAASLAALYDALPDNGIDDWIKKLAGISDTSMGDFASDLETLATGITAYSEKVGNADFNKGQVLYSVTVAKAIADLYKILPPEGGIWERLVGIPDVNQFGNDLESLGNGVVKYSEKVSSGSFDPAKIEASVPVVQSLAELAKSLPTTGESVWERLTGFSDLGDFAGDLEALGKGITAYADNLPSISRITKMGNISPFILDLVNAATIAADIPSSNPFGVFAIDLEDLGEGLIQYTSDLLKASPSLIESMNEVLLSTLDTFRQLGESVEIDGFITAMKDIGNSGIESFFESFDTANSVETLNTKIDSFLTSITDGMTEKGKTPFSEASDTLLSAFLLTFVTKEWTAYNSGWSLAGKAKDGMRDRYTDFYNAGDYVTSGFVNGLYKKLHDGTIYNAGYALGKSAEKGTRDAGVIQSPSRVFMALGQYVAQGYSNGITDSVGMVYDSAMNMGNISIDAVRNLISNIANMVDADMDTNPTIRPVLDASEIQNGMKSVNGMFNSPIATVSGRLSQNMGNVRPATAGNTYSNYSNPVYNMTFNIEGTRDMDEQALADAITNRMQIRLNKEGAVWA